MLRYWSVWSVLAAVAAVCFLVALGGAAGWWAVNDAAWLAGGLLALALAHVRVVP
jgi:hypothetical protein